MLLISLALALTYDFTHLRVSDDIRVFFPPPQNPEQDLFLALLQRNASDHHIIAAIRGGDASQRVEASRALAAAGRRSPLFAHVLNGPSVSSIDDPKVFERRYQLARPGLTQRLATPGLTAALQRRLAELRSPVGMLNRNWLTRDPTGEYLRILSNLGSGADRPTDAGVWISPDGGAAMLIFQLASAKPEYATTRSAEKLITEAFQNAAPGLTLTLSGAPILAAEARRIVQGDARKLSALGSVLVLLFLLLVFRSPRDVLLLGIPLVAGVMVALAATSFIFGSIHGITISFGVTLIGVAIDYPVHAFSHRGEKTSIWPTLMLGVVSTLIAFGALFLTGLTGLKQLGLFGIAGLLTAALVTRWLMPLGDRDKPSLRFARSRWLLDLRRGIGSAAAGRAGLVLVGGSVLYLTVAGLPPFDLDFGSLNPLPEAIRKQAQQLQHDIGRPDSGQLLGVAGASVNEVLEIEQQLMPRLDELVANNKLGGYDMAVKYLPSASRQSARLASLPGRAELETHLASALAQTPFKKDAFEPFVRDVETARAAPPVTVDDLAGSIMAPKIGSLLLRQAPAAQAARPPAAANDQSRSAAGLISLTPPIDADALTAVANARDKVWYIPLRSTAGHMLATEIRRAVKIVSAGFLVILAIVSIRFGSLRQGLRVIAAPLAAIALVLVFFQLFRAPLNLFHLVSLLLIFGLGLDYSLFFHYAAAQDNAQAHTLLSLLVSAATTIVVFGVLAVSATPALHAIGITVSFGALFSLIFAALFPGSKT